MHRPCVRLPGVEMGLKADKSVAYPCSPAQLRRCVADPPVPQLQKLRQLLSVKLADALLDILRQDEIEECLQLRVVVGEYAGLARLGALPAGDWRQGEGDVGVGLPTSSASMARPASRSSSYLRNSSQDVCSV